MCSFRVYFELMHAVERWGMLYCVQFNSNNMCFRGYVVDLLFLFSHCAEFQMATAPKQTLTLIDGMCCIYFLS